MFSKTTEKAMRDHALNVYPNESCGVVQGGEYIPLDNISPTSELPAPSIDNLTAPGQVHHKPESLTA